MISGPTGSGKSTTMNLIAQFLDRTLKEEDLFKIGNSVFSETRGIHILKKKLFHKGVQILLVDCEGQDGLHEFSQFNDLDYNKYF